MTEHPPPYCGATVHERELDNGMRVLIAERHLDPVVAVMVWYGVGARHEARAEAGVSHFLEHMMFKGTRRHGKGQVDAITTQLGGSNNAFTAAEDTCSLLSTAPVAELEWLDAVELVEARTVVHVPACREEHIPAGGCYGLQGCPTILPDLDDCVRRERLTMIGGHCVRLLPHQWSHAGICRMRVDCTIPPIDQSGGGEVMRGSIGRNTVAVGAEEAP